MDKATRPLADPINATDMNDRQQDMGKVQKGGKMSSQTGKPETTLREDVTAAGLEKVYERHGRVDLEPMPSDDPQDPLNWPAWRKNTMLGLVAWHTLMGPFAVRPTLSRVLTGAKQPKEQAAAIIPAYEVFSEEFGISITQASYLTSGKGVLVLKVVPTLKQP
jgi:hypothetical protein